MDDCRLDYFKNTNVTDKNGGPALCYYVKEKKTSNQIKLLNIDSRIQINSRRKTDTNRKLSYVRSACNTHASIRHIGIVSAFTRTFYNYLGVYDNILQTMSRFNESLNIELYPRKQ